LDGRAGVEPHPPDHCIVSCSARAETYLIRGMRLSGWVIDDALFAQFQKDSGLGRLGPLLYRSEGVGRARGTGPGPVGSGDYSSRAKGNVASIFHSDTPTLPGGH